MRTRLLAALFLIVSCTPKTRVPDPPAVATPPPTAEQPPEPVNPMERPPDQEKDPNEIPPPTPPPETTPPKSEAPPALPAVPTGPQSRAFIDKIPDEATWNTFSRTLGSDQFGKYVLDLRTNQIYFFDVNLYRMHTDFVFGVIYRKPVTNDLLTEFVKNYDADKPRFVLGYLTHHLKVDEWTYSFWENDGIRPRELRRAHQKLLATFFQGGKLKFRPDSPEQERLLPELADLATITNDKIYKSAPYQSFNGGKAIGKLRVVPPGARYEELIFNRDEIVVLQAIYPDITPVAGIVSTQFSTPLSHVNLRAKTWNIPNAGIKDAAEAFAGLDGKIVVLEVRDIDYSVRPATAREIKAWHAQTRAAKQIKLARADLATRELKMLGKIRAKDVRTYGAKTANLGEIASRNPGVKVPDGFGIPFFYYQQHLKASGLDKAIASMLADPRWPSDTAFRKQATDELRGKIIAAPLDAKLLDALWQKVQSDLGGKGVFVRSSTNAEDLEGFNGAGLYDTVPNVTEKEALATAVKTVWASVWNFRAVEERALFGIEQKSTYGGVLVQIGVNATAAGVLITKNLFDPDDKNAYTINAKRGLGLRVVGGTTVPEQIVFDTSNYGTKIVSRSDDPTMLVFDEKTGGVKEVVNDNKEIILTQYRAYLLAMAVKKIVPLYTWSKKYPLDVEWVLVGDEVWIVQARPYMSK